MGDETDDTMDILENAIKEQGLMMLRVDNINEDSMQLVEAVIRERAARIEAEDRLNAILGSLEQMTYLTTLQIQESAVKFAAIRSVATNAMDGEMNHREAFNYIVDIINTEVNQA